MRAVYRKAIADVTRRKGRTLLAILGILIGILGVTAVNEAGDQLGGAFSYSTDASAVPNITITTNQFSATEARSIQNQPGVEQLQTRATYSTAWQFAGKDVDHSMQIFAFSNAQNVQLWPFQVTSGRLPGPGEIVLDQRNQMSGYPETLGDTISIQAPDGHFVPLHVVGLSRTRGFALGGMFDNPIGYMNPTALQAIMPHAQTQILIKAPDSSVAQVYNATVQILTRDHSNVDQKSSTWRYSSGNGDTQLGVLGLLNVIRLLTVLALLLVCIMLFSSITTLLTEQIKIVGTMKSLGGTRWRIIGSYLLTIGIYSVIGTLLGLSLGLIAGYQLASWLVATVQVYVGSGGILLDAGPLQVSPWVLITSIIVGIAIPLLSALWPLLNGTRITVREATAAYGVQVGDTKPRKHRFVLTRQLFWVPQTAWLGIRGLFRKPGRALLTVLALTLASGIFLSVQLTNSSLGSTVSQYLSPIDQPDIRVDLSTKSQAAIQAIQSLPNVKQVVPVVFADAVINQQRLFLTGVPADHYTPQIVAGRWLHLHEMNAIVINEIAAQRLHLHVGDTLSMQLNLTTQQSSQTPHVSWTIVGLDRAHDYLSGSADQTGSLGEAFTSPELLNTIMHNPIDYADRLSVHTYNRSPQALLQLEQQIKSKLANISGMSQLDVRTIQELMQGYVDPLPTIYSLFNTVAILVGLVGLLSLAHTLASSVLERRLEIGILRSLGAASWRVGLVFCIEGITLALPAWALGILIGVPGGIGITRLLSAFLGPVDLSFQPLLLLTTLLFVLAVAFVASFVPALSASRVPIHGTLRYE
jgi:putative ABC transport system permease protein